MTSVGLSALVLVFGELSSNSPPWILLSLSHATFNGIYRAVGLGRQVMSSDFARFSLPFQLSD